MYSFTQFHEYYFLIEIILLNEDNVHNPIFNFTNLLQTWIFNDQ